MAKNTEGSGSNLKLKSSPSDEFYSTSYSDQTADLKSEKVEHGTTFEVFRNNTTAVEVIVKEVPYKKKKSHKNTNDARQATGDVKTHYTEKFTNEVERLKAEVTKANKRFLDTKRDFKALVFELKNQLDVVTQREIEEHTKNLNLQLENEKLKTLLESKSGVVNKLKKELINMKRTLKFVVKGMCMSPQMPDSVGYCSDIDYDEFEKGIKRDPQMKFAANLEGLISSAAGVANTFDTTLSREQPFDTEKI